MDLTWHDFIFLVICTDEEKSMGLQFLAFPIITLLFIHMSPFTSYREFGSHHPMLISNSFGLAMSFVVKKNISKLLSHSVFAID